jgi:hypothetical protein
MRIGFFACVLLVLSAHAAAQSGELWEITTQMPGMPAGMMKPQRVCQGDDPERARAAQKDNENCKVTDKKNTATRTQITMVCKSGTMSIDQKYNAARTEFTSTMSMKGKDGDFTMNMTGKKVGACDAVAARKEQDAKMAAVKKQAEVGQAQGAAAMKQAEDQMIKQCATAVDKMQYSGLGMNGQCYRKPANDKDCKSAMSAQSQMRPEVAKACNAHTAEFCKRLQTPTGFMKAESQVESAATMCGVSTKSIKASICPRAEKDGSLGFLGAHCPVEAKPLADVQCVGRDFTSKQGGKFAAFCMNYMANKDFESGKRERPAAASAPAPASASGSAPEKTQGEKSTDAVKEGVSKGIDKLRGLFGR